MYYEYIDEGITYQMFMFVDYIFLKRILLRDMVTFKRSCLNRKLKKVCQAVYPKYFQPTRISVSALTILFCWLDVCRDLMNFASRLTRYTNLKELATWPYDINLKVN